MTFLVILFLVALSALVLIALPESKIVTIDGLMDEDRHRRACRYEGEVIEAHHRCYCDKRLADPADVSANDLYGGQSPHHF